LILQLFVPNSKRLEGYTQWVYFFSKKCTPLKDIKKRYIVSLEKALGRRLFLLDKTWRYKKRLPKFNHTVLGGLSVQSTQDIPHRREKI
jgi:hypothetical protein